MPTKQSVERLTVFVRRLVADGVRCRKTWHEWRVNEANAAFMSDCFEYERLEGMPSITSLVKPFFHPELALIGLNYTQVAHNTLHKFETGWTPVLCLCRGIVFSRRGRLVAMPFPKFFNYGERNGLRIPEGPFDVTVKEDGHLMIIFWYRGHLVGTTRGSFESASAKIGNELLQAYKSDWHRKLPTNVTVCAEFIHPETKVHLEYGDLVEFRVNGAFNVLTLEDYKHSKFSLLAKRLGLPVVQRWRCETIEDLKQRVADPVFHNEEGFVAHFLESGERLKFKCKGYIGRMIGDKLTPAYIITQLVENAYDKKFADLPGEVQIEAEEIKQTLMKVVTVDGGKKAQWNYLYSLMPADDLTPYRKARCRAFRQWLVQSGKVVES